MSPEIEVAPFSWVCIPAPWHVNSPPTEANQKWILTLSGIVDINFKGNSGSTWRHETYQLQFLDKSPLTSVYGRAVPQGRTLIFEAEQWAPFATINSIYDDGQSINAGFAVDSCKPYFGSGFIIPEENNRQAKNFCGLEVLVGVRDTDSYIFKVGFQVTLLGRISVAAQGII